MRLREKTSLVSLQPSASIAALLFQLVRMWSRLIQVLPFIKRLLRSPPPAASASAAQMRSLAPSRTLIHSPHSSGQFQRWTGTRRLFVFLFAWSTLYAVLLAESVQSMYVYSTLSPLYGAHSLCALQGFVWLSLITVTHHGKDRSVGIGWRRVNQRQRNGTLQEQLPGVVSQSSA